MQKRCKSSLSPIIALSVSDTLLSVKYISAAILLLLMSACSSAPSKSSQETIPEDKVLARIDGLESRPSWLKESEVFKIENGEALSLGLSTIPGDNRPEAAIRIAENNAKARIATTIEQRLEFIFQNAEEGTSMDSTQARYIGAEASKLVTSSIRPAKVYWEKVLTFDESGNKKIIYKVFAQVGMPEVDLKKAISEAAKKRSGDNKLSADFAEKVNQHWDSFAREPAASSK